jgi:hypothetical protein
LRAASRPHRFEIGVRPNHVPTKYVMTYFPKNAARSPAMNSGRHRGSAARPRIREESTQPSSLSRSSKKRKARRISLTTPRLPDQLRLHNHYRPQQMHRESLTNTHAENLIPIDLII